MPEKDSVVCYVFCVKKAGKYGSKSSVVKFAAQNVFVEGNCCRQKFEIANY